ncbi:MAG: regulatory protein RecX [Chitinophagales bacterium]
MRYCAYQERCPADIRKKAAKFEISEAETEALIKRLIEENYIDIKRYASAYARGKFHQNKWGKVKIEQGLRQKEIDEKHIDYGLREISRKEYSDTLQKLIAQKWKSANGKNDFEKKQKLAAFLLRKGYESDLVWDLVNQIK